MKEYLRNTIMFIEDNLKSAINMDDISNHVFISKYHLQRLFKHATGMNLFSYVRARKLTSSLHELQHSAMSVLQIALEYGYDYEHTYARAFKSLFGVSPKQFRDDPRELTIIPVLDFELYENLDDHLILKPYFVYMPEMTIGAIENTVTHEEKYAYKPSLIAKDFVCNHKDKVKNSINSNEYIGYTLRTSGANDSTMYYSGVRVNDDSDIPDYFTRIAIPKGTYIVFKFVGLFSPFDITWEHLEKIWKYRDEYLIDNDEYEYNQEGYFEFVDGDICSDDYCELDLYVPWIRKSGRGLRKNRTE